jgi:hypothetical protein
MTTGIIPSVNYEPFAILTKVVRIGLTTGTAAYRAFIG